METKWINALKKLIENVGEGLDIAQLSEKSANLYGVDSELFFEAHEIHDIARSSELFEYKNETQQVFLK